jgi:NhaC family Na+:H+ antiporter
VIEPRVEQHHGRIFKLAGDGLCDATAAGPNQIAFVFCSIVAVFVAWRHGHSIEELRDAAVASVTTGLSAIFILLAVGSLIGTWALSGTITAMVY